MGWKFRRALLPECIQQFRSKLSLSSAQIDETFMSPQNGSMIVVVNL